MDEGKDDINGMKSGKSLSLMQQLMDKQQEQSSQQGDGTSQTVNAGDNVITGTNQGPVSSDNQHPPSMTDPKSQPQNQQQQPGQGKPKGKDLSQMSKLSSATHIQQITPQSQQPTQVSQGSSSQQAVPGKSKGKDLAAMVMANPQAVTGNTTNSPHSTDPESMKRLQQQNAARIAAGMQPLGVSPSNATTPGIDASSSFTSVSGDQSQQQQNAPIPSLSSMSPSTNTVANVPTPKPQPVQTPKPTRDEATLSSTQSTSTANVKPPMIGMKISSLLHSLDPSGTFELDEDAEEQLLALANDFASSLIQKSMRIAKHRHTRNKSGIGGGRVSSSNNSGKVVEVGDVSIVLKKNWGITIPGLSSTGDRINPKGRSTLKAMEIMGSSSESKVQPSINEGNDGNIIDEDAESRKRKRTEDGGEMNPVKKMNTALLG